MFFLLVNQFKCQRVKNDFLTDFKKSLCQVVSNKNENVIYLFVNNLIMCSCKNKPKSPNQDALMKSFVNNSVEQQKNEGKKTREELLAELRRRMHNATR